MTRTLTETGRDLMAAANMVANGWCQSMFSDADGGVCAIHAVEIACERDARRMRAALDAVKRHIGGIKSVSTWNDRPGRTQAEVVAALQGAALAA